MSICDLAMQIAEWEASSADSWLELSLIEILTWEYIALIE